MNPKNPLISLFSLFFLSFSIHGATSQTRSDREASRTTERQLRVEIAGGYGRIFIRRAQNDKVFTIYSKNENQSDDKLLVQYRIKDSRGNLKIELNADDDDERNVDALACLVRGKKTAKWELELSDRIPINLDFELGAGEANLDLTDLRMQSVKVEAGASRLRITCATPNPEQLHTLSISAGVGSVQSEHLGNLNFEALEFEGGLGSYVLDLTGALRNDATVSTDLGMGSLVIVLPEGIGVRAMNSDSWFTSAHFQDFIRKSDDEYLSKDYLTARRKMNMDLNTGVGSVTVKWKK